MYNLHSPYVGRLFVTLMFYIILSHFISSAISLFSSFYFSLFRDPNLHSPLELKPFISFFILLLNIYISTISATFECFHFSILWRVLIPYLVHCFCLFSFKYMGVIVFTKIQLQIEVVIYFMVSGCLMIHTLFMKA